MDVFYLKGFARIIMATKPKSTGAPANALLLETHAADAEREVVRVKEQLAALRGLIQPNGNKEEQASLNDQISKLQRDLESSYDLWFKLSKQVREYDRSVSESRREGEVIPRDTVQEFFAQLILSYNLAIESYIISLAQDATRSESPEAFYQMHADNLRSCVTAALEKAEKDGKLPKWAVIV